MSRPPGRPTSTPAERGSPARRARPGSARRGRGPWRLWCHPVRLAKFLAGAGVASRRAAEEIVRAGRVTVDGEAVTTPPPDAPDTREALAPVYLEPVRPQEKLV